MAPRPGLGDVATTRPALDQGIAQEGPRASAPGHGGAAVVQSSGHDRCGWLSAFASIFELRREGGEEFDSSRSKEGQVDHRDEDKSGHTAVPTRQDRLKSLSTKMTGAQQPQTDKDFVTGGARLPQTGKATNNCGGVPQQGHHKRRKYVKAVYGNWVRWTPPQPKPQATEQQAEQAAVVAALRPRARDREREDWVHTQLQVIKLIDLVTNKVAQCAEQCRVNEARSAEQRKLDTALLVQDLEKQQQVSAVLLEVVNSFLNSPPVKARIDEHNARLAWGWRRSFSKMIRSGKNLPEITDADLARQHESTIAKLKVRVENAKKRRTREFLKIQKERDWALAGWQDQCKISDKLDGEVREYKAHVHELILEHTKHVAKTQKKTQKFEADIQRQVVEIGQKLSSKLVISIFKTVQDMYAKQLAAENVPDYLLPDKVNCFIDELRTRVAQE